MVSKHTTPRCGKCHPVSVKDPGRLTKLVLITYILVPTGDKAHICREGNSLAWQKCIHADGDEQSSCTEMLPEQSTTCAAHEYCSPVPRSAKCLEMVQRSQLLATNRLLLHVNHVNLVMPACTGLASKVARWHLYYDSWPCSHPCFRPANAYPHSSGS